VLTADDTLGPDADQAAQERAALTLLRCYPYLAEDAIRDGKRPPVSAQVREAPAEHRAARRDAPDLPRAREGRDDARWQWRTAFSDGLWAWVPDDTASGPAAGRWRTSSGTATAGR